MSGAAEPLPDRGGGVATLALLAAATAVFGLLGGLPLVAGPAFGAGGVVVSGYLRARHRFRLPTLSLLPALGTIGILAATAPPVPSTELFAGLTGLAFLLWVADDPARPAGGGRRAVPTIALGALGVGLAWSITLAVPSRGPDVGLAGALLAAALVLVAVLVARLPRITLGVLRNA